MDEPESTKTVNVRAQDSSVISGRHAIVKSLQQKAQIPQVSVTRDSHSTEESFSNTTVNIETHECDVSVADDTAVLVNIKPPEETEEPDSEPIPRGDSSTHVTGGKVEGSKNLHFLVREHGKYIQIGQCCLIVEINADDQMLEQLRARGTLEVKIGTSLVTITWRDIEADEEEMKARIKVQLKTSLTEKLQTLEKTVIRDLVDNNFDKCQQLVAFLFTKLEGYLTDISTGCFQLTVVFPDYEKLNRGTSSEAMSEIQKFLNSLLVTEGLKKVTIDVGFTVTFIDQEVNQNTAIVDRREPTTTTLTDRKRSEPASLGTDALGEILAKDQFTRQIREQVQQSLTEELARFRLEHTKILRDAVSEVLPEMEQRIIEISRKHHIIDMPPPPLPPRLPLPLSEPWKTSTESEKIGELVSFVQSKVTGSKPEIMITRTTQPKDEGKSIRLSDINVLPWTKPLDFSYLFDAVLGKSSKQDYERSEGLTSLDTSEHHENLARILEHEELRSAQCSLELADQAIEEVKDDFVIFQDFCTVLCFDLGFEKTAMRKQKIIGETIVKGCLGYVCVTSVGEEPKVMQELTKEKKLALTAIEQLHQTHIYEKIESSRFIDGLFTALKLLHGRVTPTDYGPHYTLYPRIVFITSDPNSYYSMATVMDVLRAMSVEIPVYFVGIPIILGLLLPSRMFVIGDMEFPTDSMVTEILIGNVLNVIMAPEVPDTPYRSWQRIKKQLKRDNNDKDLETVTWFVTEHFKHPPPIGTRIMRSRTSPPQYGTVLGITKSRTALTPHYAVLVVFDTGDCEVYHWEFTQKELSFYKDTPSTVLSEFPVGTLVREGPSDYPHTPAYLGVVIQNVDKDFVKVFWRTTDVFPLSRHKQPFSIYAVHKTSEIRLVESPLIDLEVLTGIAKSPPIGLKALTGDELNLKKQKDEEDKWKKQHTLKPFATYTEKGDEFKIKDEEKGKEEWKELYTVKTYQTFKKKASL